MRRMFGTLKFSLLSLGEYFSVTTQYDYFLFSFFLAVSISLNPATHLTEGVLRVFVCECAYIGE